ncbi:MAG: FAD-dependent oxidoreductase [Bacteroidetes bacterium]|nr:FAD-dependent oxidoreductase [Bacteroidota bacterium]
MPPSLSHQQARIEAERCLFCFDAPCVKACPTHIRIPMFIAMIRSGNVKGSAELVRTSNALAMTCGTVCPEEIFCQSVCTRGKQDQPIQIREKHQYATTHGESSKRKPALPPRTGKRVAVIGGGPSGLGCAFELAKFGYRVDVYEEKKPGGVPRNSIPSYRLNDKQLEMDTKLLSSFFTIKRGPVSARTFDKVRASHDAAVLAIGLGEDRTLGVKGEDVKGVYPVLEFLERAKSSPRTMKIGKRVVVVGGGNVSLDAAATAKRLGAERVTLIYRRGEREMRVWKSELEEARRQGVEVRFLTNPVAFLGTKRVEGVKCRETILGKKKDRSGRPIPVEVKGSDFVLEAEMVIIAVGQTIRADWLGELKRRASGYLVVDERFRTSMANVYAVGDVIAGEGTIVQSVAHGKHAAQAIHHQLSERP